MSGTTVSFKVQITLSAVTWGISQPDGLYLVSAVCVSPQEACLCSEVRGTKEALEVQLEQQGKELSLLQAR